MNKLTEFESYQGLGDKSVEINHCSYGNATIYSAVIEGRVSLIPVYRELRSKVNKDIKYV